jgi:hypothetical protein
MAYSPLEAAAAQSRSGKSYTTKTPALGGLAPAWFAFRISARVESMSGTLDRVSIHMKEGTFAAAAAFVAIAPDSCGMAMLETSEA